MVQHSDINVIITLILLDPSIPAFNHGYAELGLGDRSFALGYCPVTIGHEEISSPNLFARPIDNALLNEL